MSAADERFGATLREYRKAAGMTMGALARALQVSTAYLSDVEHGRRPPLTLNRLKVAAEALGVPFESLVFARACARGEITLFVTHGNARTAARLEIAWHRLTVEQKRAVADLAESLAPVAP